MTQEPLNIRSTPDDRQQAVAACIREVMSKNPGTSQEKATAICIDAANKAMGTRESTERPQQRQGILVDENYAAEIIGGLISLLVLILIMYIRMLSNTLSTWRDEMRRDQGDQWSHITKIEVEVGKLQERTAGD